MLSPGLRQRQWCRQSWRGTPLSPLQGKQPFGRAARSDDSTQDSRTRPCAESSSEPRNPGHHPPILGLSRAALPAPSHPTLFPGSHCSPTGGSSRLPWASSQQGQEATSSACPQLEGRTLWGTTAQASSHSSRQKTPMSLPSSTQAATPARKATTAVGHYFPWGKPCYCL